MGWSDPAGRVVRHGQSMHVRRRATLAPTRGLARRRWVTVGTPDRLLDASALRDWAHTAVSDLITHIDEINRLNVFPVADSDTGANMLFTMRSALAEANAGAGTEGVARVAAALSAGALNGARGNSGVILSQILRGIADVTAAAAADRGGELSDIDVDLLGAALRRGIELVITSMGGEEIPGTIISVLRAAARAVEECANGGEGLVQAQVVGLGVDNRLRRTGVALQQAVQRMERHRRQCEREEHRQSQQDQVVDQAAEQESRHRPLTDNCMRTG